ncbi:MAG: acyl-CoA dehydrogenase [Bdellovibrionaceae bacterium]|nr:acyl-CoA dehydrogenase [Pseudobdellovibrionaceae bacterium]|tara:strand:- start:6765 stop:7922 length:1158 start_codon:yes stop_codon:yes gene_type:complete
MSDSFSALTILQDDEQAFREAVREFAEGEIKPKVLEMDEKAQMDPGLIKQYFEMGLMGIETPEQYGGAGGSFTMACLAVEELGRVDGSVSVMVDVQNTLVTNAFLKWANEDQKKKYLPKMASEWVGAYALSESGSGSDAFALKLKAEDKGDKFVLNGHKLWITNANEANLFLVFANIDPSQGYKGITGFIVERDFPGFSVGKKEDKLGIRASSTCELIFENCEVPKENVIGEVGKGYKIAIETLNEGRIGIGAQMLGISQGAYDATLEYIKTREQFGKSLSHFQGVQFQLSEMRCLLESTRLHVYNAARLKDMGRDFVKDAAMAKLIASRNAEKIASMAVDLFGGNGFTKEYPIEKFYRDAKIGQIYEGTSNMQLQTIAKMELNS